MSKVQGKLICRHYSTGHGCRDGTKCQYAHVCQWFVKGDCHNQDNCPWPHIIADQSQPNFFQLKNESKRPHRDKAGVCNGCPEGHFRLTVVPAHQQPLCDVCNTQLLVDGHGCAECLWVICIKCSKIVEQPSKHPIENQSSQDNRERLNRIFTVYAPEKLLKLDETLSKWKGKETSLFEKLQKKYGPEPTQEQFDQAESAPTKANREPIGDDNDDAYSAREKDSFQCDTPPPHHLI